MTTIVSGRFETTGEARGARDDLERLGVPPADIILSNADDGSTGLVDGEGDGGAKTSTGVLVGGGAGLVTGLAVAAVAAPVVAPIAAAGFVAAAATGALVGGAAGDLAATLKADDADGDHPVTVGLSQPTLSANVDETLVTDARHALAAHGALDVAQTPARAAVIDGDAALVPSHATARAA